MNTSSVRIMEAVDLSGPATMPMLPACSGDPEDTVPMLADDIGLPTSMRLPRGKDATVRTQRSTATLMTRKRALTMLIVGSVALVAALAACVAYMNAPPRAKARQSATSR